MASPNSFRDPYWSDLASRAEEKHGIRPGLLVSVLTNGERSNADQVSEAKARTPFQVIPQTRDLVLKRDGIDAYLSDENAAEVAALVLKDGANWAKRRAKDPIEADALTAGYYHAGGDMANWGPKTKNYVNRVMVGQVRAAKTSTTAAPQGGSTFDQVMAQMSKPQESEMASVLQAYESGQMEPADRAAFEADVNAGRVMLPRGKALAPSSVTAADPAARAGAGGSASATAVELPADVAQAYNTGKMSSEDRSEVDQLLKSGSVRLPQGVALQAPPEVGLMAKAGDMVTGNLRRTPTTDAHEDWGNMPEINGPSFAAVKAKIGTLTGGPAEMAQIIKANFPGVQMRQDEKGNFLLQSAQNGKEYAIKPGFQFSDIPRAVGVVGAFTPAGAARTVLGAAAGAGLTQAAIEGSQAATGGSFDPAEIGVAALGGAAVPAAARAGRALMDVGKGAAAQIRGPGTQSAAGTATSAPRTPATAPEQPFAGQASVPVERPSGGRSASPARPAPTQPVMPAQVDIPPSVAPAGPTPLPAATVAAAPEPVAQAGQMIWRNADTDIPVVFKRVEPQPGPDGRMYARVEVSGRESFVPAEELVAPASPALRAPQPDPMVPAVVPQGQAPQAVPPGAPAPVKAMSPDELAGTARTAALGGFGSKKATQELASQAAPDAETVAAAKRLGVLDYLQPDHVTTNQAYRQLAQLVKSQTGSSAAAAQREGLLRVAEKADELVAKLGGSADLSSLSANAAQQMQATNTTLKASARQLYAKVDAAIGLDGAAPSPNILGLIRSNAKKLGGEENLPAVERDLLKRLSPKPDGTEPTYALLDKLRKDIGEAKRGKQNAFGSLNESELIQLENALRADQAAIAKKAGVGEVWEMAQQISRTYKGVQDDIKAIYGKELNKSMAPLLTGSIKALDKGNTTKFINLIKATPENLRQEVTASGLASFFQRTTRGGEMDFAGFSRWFEGLERNKQAYIALMSNLPAEARQQLADLARVSRGVAMSKGEFIATGKALNPKALEAADGLMQRIYEEAKSRGVAGVVAEVVGTSSGAPGLATALQSAVGRGAKPSIMKAADDLITSPQFLALVHAVGTPKEKAAVRQFISSKAFNRLRQKAASPAELKVRERLVQMALQGVNSTSDNEGDGR